MFQSLRGFRGDRDPPLCSGRASKPSSFQSLRGFRGDRDPQELHPPLIVVTLFQSLRGFRGDRDDTASSDRDSGGQSVSIPERV